MPANLSIYREWLFPQFIAGRGLRGLPMIAEDLTHCDMYCGLENHFSANPPPSFNVTCGTGGKGTLSL